MRLNIFVPLITQQPAVPQFLLGIVWMDVIYNIFQECKHLPPLKKKNPRFIVLEEGKHKKKNIFL